MSIPADLLEFTPATVKDIDLDAIMADMDRTLAELPTFDLEKLLEDLEELDLDAPPFTLPDLV